MGKWNAVHLSSISAARIVITTPDTHSELPLFHFWWLILLYY